MSNPLGHMAQKLLAERARNQLEASPSTAPPPYSAEEDDDISDDDEEGEYVSTPVKLVVNATQIIRGSNNLLPTSTAILADISALSQNLATTLAGIDNVVEEADGETSTLAPRRRRRAIKIDLTVHCGITVIGDKNVIGNVALKPRPSPGRATSEEGQSVTTTGAKRPAEEENAEAPPAKRVSPESARPSV